MDEASTFAKLSNELCISIFGHLPKSALKIASQVSWRFHELCIPILYHTIDLSFHNYEPVPQMTTNSPGFSRWPTNMQSIQVTQDLFILQLLKKPQYARFVRDFTWTLGIQYCAPVAGGCNRDTGLWPRLSKEVYDMLALLDRATRIDIDGGPYHFNSLELLGLTTHPSLFQGARNIRIGGKMHYALASAILHGEGKAPLTSLEINNLQEGGLLSTGENFSLRVYRHGSERREYVDLSTFVEDWPLDSVPRQVGPGIMRRLLNASLRGRCQHLRHLSLRKQGQQLPHQELPSDLTHDDDVYREWVAFILEVRPASLLLAHCGYTFPPKSITTKSPQENLRLDGRAPMDKRFRAFVLPILKQGWRGLTRLEIKGVSKNGLEVLGNLDSVEAIIDENLPWIYNATVGVSLIR